MMSMSFERSNWIYGIALCRPRQFQVAMEIVDGLSGCDCGGCERRVDEGPEDLLLQTLTTWESLLEESSMQTLLEDLNLEGFIFNPNHR